MQTATEIATALRQHYVTDDPDLAALVAAWPELPDAIRVGILAMVKAAKTKRTDQGQPLFLRGRADIPLYTLGPLIGFP